MSDWYRIDDKKFDYVFKSRFHEYFQDFLLLEIF